MLKLEPGERVLDVGCGIGGGDFYMATTYGAYVHGIDLSVNMVLIALERAQEQQHTLVSRPSMNQLCTRYVKELATVGLHCVWPRWNVTGIFHWNAQSRCGHSVVLQLFCNHLRMCNISNLLQSQVSFEIADCMTAEFQPESFDVIYSRDTLLHIHDKPALFARCVLLLAWCYKSSSMRLAEDCDMSIT